MWKAMFRLLLACCAATSVYGLRPFHFRHRYWHPPKSKIPEAPRMSLQLLQEALSSAKGSSGLGAAASRHFSDIVYHMNKKTTGSLKLGDVWVTKAGKVGKCSGSPCKFDNSTVKFSATGGTADFISFGLDAKTPNWKVENSATSDTNWPPFSMKFTLPIRSSLSYNRNDHLPKWSSQIFITSMPKSSEVQMDLVVNPVSCQVSVRKVDYSVPFTEEWCDDCNKMERSLFREAIKNQIIGPLSRVTDNAVTNTLKEVLCTAYKKSGSNKTTKQPKKTKIG